MIEQFFFEKRPSRIQSFQITEVWVLPPKKSKHPHKIFTVIAGKPNHTKDF